MNEHPILGQVVLGYCPMIDRQRAITATRLTVFPQRPDSTPDAAALLQALAEAWPAEGKAALEASLAAHLKSVNATLDPHEQLQCIVLVTTPWTVDNDLITPTFKVKRNRIEDVYAANYERWENSGKKVIWHNA